MIGVLAAAREPAAHRQARARRPVPALHRRRRLHRRLHPRGHRGAAGVARQQLPRLVERDGAGDRRATPTVRSSGEELTDSFCRTDPEIAARFARVTFISDNRADLAGSASRRSCCSAATTRSRRARSGEYVHRAIPGSTFVPLAATGHCPNLSAPRGDDRRDPCLRLTRAFDESAEDLYENAPCGYLSAAPDGTIVRVNGTFLRWTGYRAERARRRQALPGPAHASGGRIYHETHYAPLLRMQGSVREIALEIVGADGGRLPVLVNSVLLSRRGRRAAGGADDRLRRHRAQALRARAAGRARSRARGARADRAPPAHHRRARRRARRPRDRVRGDGELVEASGADRAASRSSTRDGAARRVVRHGEPDPATSPGSIRAGVRRGRGRTPGRVRAVAARSGARRARPAVARVLRGPRVRARGACVPGRVRPADRARAGALPALRGDRATSPTRSSAACSPALRRATRGSRWRRSTSPRSSTSRSAATGTTPSRSRAASSAIVVGDVVGRGLAAASAMGQLRSAVRALAGAGLEPAAVLRHLDTFVEQVEAARYATLAYAGGRPRHRPGDLRVGGAPAAGPARARARARALHGGPLPAARRHRSRQPAPPGGLRAGAGGRLPALHRRARRAPRRVDRRRARAPARSGTREPGRFPAQLVETLPRALLERAGSEDDVCLLSFRLSDP